MPNNDETYARVTAAMTALVEAGDLLPWQRPWKGNEFARSISTGKRYNGINLWVLTATAEINGWSPWWGTYKKIAELGGQIRKGEKSTLCILWSPKEIVDKVSGEKKKIMFLRTYNVFSASQADGLPAKYYDKPEASDLVADETAEEVFAGYVTREGIQLTHGGSKAFYRPGTDSITLPAFEAFDTAEHYYSTAFHEAGHSTGAKKRLNRPEIQNFHHFGDDLYSREELVAEFTSALVLGTLGLDKPNVVANQASYLKSWLKALQNDPQALVWAAGRAEKAANLILNVAPVTYDEKVAA